MTRPDHCRFCGAYQCQDCGERALTFWAYLLAVVATLALIVVVSAV